MRALSLLVVLSLFACPRHKETPKPAPVTGVLVIEGAPRGAVLTLDEADSYPLAQKSRLPVVVGVHRVTVECDGYFPAYEMVTVVEKKESKLTLSMRPYLPD